MKRILLITTMLLLAISSLVFSEIHQKDSLVSKYNDKSFVGVKTIAAELIDNSTCYDDYVENLKQFLIKNKNFDAKKVNKDNMAFAKFIYDDIDLLHSKLSELKNSASEVERKSIVYGEIANKLSKLDKIKDEIYKYSYSFEKSKFKKSTGNVFYENNDISTENWIAELTEIPGWQPEIGYIYSLNSMKSIQTVSGGILMTNAYGYGNKVEYLQTNKSFVDEQVLDGNNATFLGTYSYDSNFGKKKVYSFKFYEVNENQVVNGTRFYFYPKLLDITEITNEVMFDAFGLDPKNKK